jgi:hypothetical protein
VCLRSKQETGRMLNGRIVWMLNLLIGQKKLTCRIGAKEWFSNRFGCKDSPNGEPEYPANEPCLKYTYKGHAQRSVDITQAWKEFRSDVPMLTCQPYKPVARMTWLEHHQWDDLMTPEATDLQQDAQWSQVWVTHRLIQLNIEGTGANLSHLLSSMCYRRPRSSVMWGSSNY